MIHGKPLLFKKLYPNLIYSELERFMTVERLKIIMLQIQKVLKNKKVQQHIRYRYRLNREVDFLLNGYFLSGTSVISPLFILIKYNERSNSHIIILKVITHGAIMGKTFRRF